MAYRYDPDLEFLGTCSSEELNDLVYLLTHDPKDGESRWTEFLTKNTKYKRYYPDHQKYWEEIAEEIQLFGGNSIVNFFRKRGVPYKEVLCDVCDKMKVNYNKNSSTKQIEQNLLMKILEKALDEMKPEELEQLSKELGLDNQNKPTPQIMMGMFITIFKMGGFKSYQLTLVIANAVLKALVGRGLALAGNAALARGAALLVGPIGWAITALFTAIDVAGPAYRVTIPAVIQVVYLRTLVENRQNIEMAKQVQL
ncbi:DUF3944 domain-containing protein [Ursidibacter arcticus]